MALARRHFPGRDLISAARSATCWLDGTSSSRSRGARPAAPRQGTFDLEIEIPKLVYERLGTSTDREWDVSIHPGSIQVLPAR